MPYVVNGIGTWHYGRSRVHELKGQCAACGNYGPLASFDTTLYFVVFFVPLIPLGKKRILEQCGACQRHRYMKLADWEKAKGRVLSDLTTALQSGIDKDA